METRCKSQEEETFKVEMSYDCCLGMPSIGLSMGFMLFWNNDLDVRILSFSQGHIDASITKDNKI